MGMRKTIENYLEQYTTQRRFAEKKKKKFDCRSLLFYVITVNLLEIIL